MHNSSILPADTFLVTTKNIFTDYDQKIMLNLYQPIIGTTATNLYFTLQTFLNNAEKTHYYIMVNMRLNLEEIIDARTKLEGIGLLKTYISNDSNLNKVIYELYSPLSVYEFVSSPLLNTLLLNNLGKKDYDEIINRFKINSIDLSSYTEITKSFSNVFHISTIDVNDNIDTSFEQKIKNNINVKADINLNNILSLIPDDLLNKKSITNEQINLINNLSFVYNLDDLAISEIIINSIDNKKHIDKELLRVNCTNYFNFNNEGKISKAIYNKQPENLQNKNGDTTKQSKIIYTFENVSPYDFLASKYENGKPSKSDLKILDYLSAELGMMPGVINVLIDYILRTNNNKLSKAYVDAVASQWMKSHIVNVKDAIAFAKNEYNKQKSIKKTNKSEAPKWINEDVKSEIASIEEQNEMSKMLKELVGEK